MKKNFFRVGAFAGLAISALVLASCGENVETSTEVVNPTTTEVVPTTTVEPTTTEEIPETVEITDLDGKVFTVSETKDANVVTKALLLSALSGVQAEKSPYAIALDAALLGSITAEGNGVTGTINANVNASVAASIGDKPYTAFDVTKDLTEADIEKAVGEVNNIAAVASLKGDVQFSDFVINEKDPFFTKYPTALEQIKPQIEALAKEKVHADLRAFIKDNTAYGEFFAHIPEVVLEAVDSHAKSDIDYTPKSEDIFTKVAPMVTTVLSDYQNLSLINFYNKYVETIDFDEDAKIQLVPIDLSMVNAEFFESETYQMVVSFVEALGIEISEIKDGVATFSLDITGAKVKSFLKQIGQDKIATMANAVLPNDESLVKIALDVDLAKARLNHFEVYTSAVETIGNLVLAYATLQMPEDATLPVESVKGSLGLAIDVKYDADVNAVAEPKEGIEYTVAD